MKWRVRDDECLHCPGNEVSVMLTTYTCVVKLHWIASPAVTATAWVLR
jgi:hypothetical protein